MGNVGQSFCDVVGFRAYFSNLEQLKMVILEVVLAILIFKNWFIFLQLIHIPIIIRIERAYGAINVTSGLLRIVISWIGIHKHLAAAGLLAVLRTRVDVGVACSVVWTWSHFVGAELEAIFLLAF